jgi:hypothetical protein
MEYSRNASKHKTAAPSVTVYDGRERLGTVREAAGRFVTITVNGTVIGEFASLREAAAALPNGGAQ